MAPSSTTKLGQAFLVLVALVAARAAPAQDLAITHVNLYPAPGAPHVDDATLIMRDGRVAAVGRNLPTDGLDVLDGALTRRLPPARWVGRSRIACSAGTSRSSRR